jgi:aspartyl-tRNA(Asn)/glutamyl-tRNA(Gln) amidotransferase subunit A
MATLAQLAADLASGATTSEALVEDCLARIADDDGEGARAFVQVTADEAVVTARSIDRLRSAGAEPSPLAGIPVSVKDLFDVRGQITRAGSRVLDGEPARADAPAVARWRRAGLIPVGRTNMTEFAYSGLGLNPHYGTPANPWDRRGRRIPGGSSSGAAVSVSDHMAHGGLGSDTGGSCRIPAALCGLVGYKPTQATVPLDGTVPLSSTLDSVGVIARSVDCAGRLFGLLRGQAPSPVRALTRPPRLAVVRTYVFDDVDAAVSADLDRAIARLADAGADVVDVELPELDGLAEMNGGGGFPAAEAYAWHHDLIQARADAYDPRVISRIRRGERQSARDLIVLHGQRRALIDAVGARVEGVDALLGPTVPQVAPPMAELDDDEAYARVNLLMLRNPTVINLLDGCAASVPMHAPGAPPTGLMVAGLHNTDDTVLRVAAWVEEQL